MVTLLRPVMLKTNTMALAVAGLAPPRSTRHAGDVTTVDMEPAAFSAVPAEAETSEEESAAATQFLEPDIPFMYSVPEPKFEP